MIGIADLAIASYVAFTVFCKAFLLLLSCTSHKNVSRNIVSSYIPTGLEVESCIVFDRQKFRPVRAFSLLFAISK